MLFWRKMLNDKILKYAQITRGLMCLVLPFVSGKKMEEVYSV